MKPQPTFANIYASNSPFWWNMQELFRPREHFSVFLRLARCVRTCQYLTTFYELFNNWRYVSINVHIRKHVVSVNKASCLFLLCLINDRGIYPTFSGFALASSYVIFSVRSLFKSYFLGVRSEFNTHNPAICQTYFYHYLTKTSPL